jgi:predicted metalloprotease with PDZ domain
MAHELMHFWNGLSLIPATLSEEWFQEGFTDYVTSVSMYRAGLFDEAWLYRRFEAMQSRYAIGRFYQRSQASLQQAGHDKQPLRTLVYGGGAIVAIALEAQMRNASKGHKGIRDLMQSLFVEFGHGDNKYTTDDIVRHVKAVSGADVSQFFARFVVGSEYLPIESYLQQMGLHMESFLEETIITRDRAPTESAQRNFKAAYGR